MRIHGVSEEALLRGGMEWLYSNTRPFRELMAYYRCAMMEIETKLNVLNQEFSVQHERNPIESIKSRLKEPASIVDKILRNNYPMTIESLEANLSDVAGVRVICSFVEDIYLLADCLLKQDDIALIRAKDYIKKPKENGYRSLHLIVEVPIFLAHKKKPMKVEIQLRTIAMDFWASLEHKLKYKKDVPDAEALTEELKQCALMSAQLDERMESIRKRVLGDEKI
ncbi:MAG: GTP pyrophosphokinase family protein [Clostridia bacterium]|nr:GTP pyrophosphokinase family protein [Clostridia bacterium]MBQ4157892.1 GTP pyrophosphokinase family protein [Clostridia bacterium]